MLSRQQRQSLALHCIANGCQTISQERKEFCSAVHHVMVTWFNAVASDPWAKCDNWHYYHHQCIFCCFFHVSFWSECSFWLCSAVTYLSVFYTADWAQRSVACYVFILCWYAKDCITICNLQTCFSYFSVCSQDFPSSFTSIFTLTALHALKTQKLWNTIWPHMDTASLTKANFCAL